MRNRHPYSSQRAVAGLACLCLALLVAAGCSQDIEPRYVFNLQRPTAITFACHGDLRITGGEPATADQEIIVSAQPIDSCKLRLAGEVPEGQEEVPVEEGAETLHGPLAPNFVAFALQTAKGTVAVVNITTTGGDEWNPVTKASVDDSDPLTPGKNSIPIGTLPIGLVWGVEGCHVVSANAGSCDLSILDVNSALDHNSPTLVERVPILDAAGEALLAKPRAIVAEPAGGQVGYTCPDRPGGLVYLAYPECHMVAVVEPATGQIVASLRFHEDGSVEIAGGDVTCPVQCGDGHIAALTKRFDDPAARPVAMHMAGDGARLYIGAENSPEIFVVLLDADRLPVLVERVAVEGEVGITSVTATEVISMGGNTGNLGDGSAGAFQFVYAVATDRTVRVVDVHDLMVECDTQVDPRYVYETRDVHFLSCMPAGDPGTPPRRPGARSPGIHFPRDSVPLDVAVTPADVKREEGKRPVTAPANMVGWFAFVTMSDGYVYVVNIDDDNYSDFENVDDPIAVYMPLAIPHQLRDFVTDRDAIDGTEGIDTPKCAYPTFDPNNPTKGPRLLQPVSQVIDIVETAANKIHFLPFLRSLQCVDDTGLDVAVTEMGFGAPMEIREQTFPDLFALRHEEWRLAWEGRVSLDSSSVSIDGPPVRRGFVDEIRADSLVLGDGGAPFCSAGVEPYDIAVLLGCDPSNGDAECGLGQTCYVHPETPTGVRRGLCLPTTRVDDLSEPCREVLTSRRRYSVLETHSDHLVLAGRRRVLRTTPIEGCADADQCADFADLERALSVDDHPFGLVLPTPEVEYTWACEADPSRAPGPDKCVMTCEAAEGCEPGWTCADGHCIEGPIPKAACVGTLQRYEMRVGEAFAVVGEVNGFLHHRIADEATGMCIDDPAGHPLVVGRLTLNPPPCAGDGLLDFDPNPCTTTVEHFEEYVPYEFSGSACEAPGTDFRTREATAVRFRNPAVTFHLVDPYTNGDAECNMDLAGEGPAFPTVYLGYQLRFRITGARYPMFVQAVRLAFPFEITPDPIGGLWILDQGDIAGSITTSPTQGQIVRIEPDQAGNAFSSITLR